MANTISIWNNQIILNWDGKIPEGCDHSPAAVMFAPKLVLPYWKHIGPYTKWVEKLKKFIMSLSVQNLQRLRKEFGGDVDVQNGYRHIEQLKKDFADYKRTRDEAMRIKEGDLWDIPYKLPPLGQFQHVGVNLLVRCSTVPLFADCGLGKSFMVLTSCQEQFRRGLVAPGKVLVTGKLQTLETGWLADCEKFTYMKAVMVWCKPCAKRKEKLIALLNTPADIYIINHDGVRVLEEELIDKKFEKVVIDESTILKGYLGDRFGSGKFGKAITKIAEHAKYKAILSGSPSPNTVQDLWGQFNFLDPNGFVIEPSVHDFRHTYMKEVFFGSPTSPNTRSTWIPQPDAEMRVGEIITPLSYRIRIRDVLPDLPPETYIDRYVEMSKEQRQHYDAMAEEMLTIIEDKTIEASMKLAQIAKLRQVTGGFLIDAQEQTHAIEENPKMDMLRCLLDEEIASDEKVVIFAQYRYEIETIHSCYKTSSVTVYGGNNSATNLDNIKKFLNDPEVRIIIAHPASAGHGLTFTISCYLINYSISYSAELNYQGNARIIRASQKRATFIYYLLCKDSIDEIIKLALERKKGAQQAVIDQDIVDMFTALKRGDRRGKGKKDKNIP